MFRSIVLNSNKRILSTCVVNRGITPQIITYRYKSSILDSAKETLSNLNKKIGDVAVSGIDKTLDVAESVKGTVKETDIKGGLDSVNKKVGKAAASGIENLQKAANSVDTEELKENVKGTARDVKDTAGLKLDDAKSTAKSTLDNASENVKDVAEDAKEVAKDARDATESGYSEAVEGAKDTIDSSKSKVAEESLDHKKFGSSSMTKDELIDDKQYSKLQKKGKDSYIEQNRPEDFM